MRDLVQDEESKSASDSLVAPMLDTSYQICGVHKTLLPIKPAAFTSENSKFFIDFLAVSIRRDLTERARQRHLGRAALRKNVSLTTSMALV